MGPSGMAKMPVGSSEQAKKYDLREVDMAALFSDDWMKSYMEHWNADSELTGALGQIGQRLDLQHLAHGIQQARMAHRLGQIGRKSMP